MPRKKKKNPKPRSSRKYPGLVKEEHPRTRWEYIDQDYVDKLSDEMKALLSNFNEEFYGGYFGHPGKILHKKKSAKKDCYNRNNSQNRDIYAINRTRGWQEPSDSTDSYKITDTDSHEKVLVELLDLKKKLENS